MCTLVRRLPGVGEHVCLKGMGRGKCLMALGASESIFATLISLENGFCLLSGVFFLQVHRQWCKSLEFLRAKQAVKRTCVSVGRKVKPAMTRLLESLVTVRAGVRAFGFVGSLVVPQAPEAGITFLALTTGKDLFIGVHLQMNSRTLGIRKDSITVCADKRPGTFCLCQPPGDADCRLNSCCSDQRLIH